MKNPEQIAADYAERWANAPARGAEFSTVEDTIRSAIEADRAQLHGLGANDYEVEPDGDASGAWVNIILWRRDPDADGERVALGSLLLSPLEANDMRRELRIAGRDAEHAYRRAAGKD